LSSNALMSEEMFARVFQTVDYQTHFITNDLSLFLESCPPLHQPLQGFPLCKATKRP
jgi:hypothetical protein